MRPTKEQVDAALTLAARHPSRAVNTLAAEVRALREVVDAFDALVYGYRRTLARVEALASSGVEVISVTAIRAALRGEP